MGWKIHTKITVIIEGVFEYNFYYLSNQSMNFISKTIKLFLFKQGFKMIINCGV